ncbi:MAG TPA: sugar phosphate isomerase/epimerase family protein [Candidatus Angelobacter sp.]|jgi:sugar phosphate isomerase/epimerase|nr:sugar phosphate isomerase/epimerase family protein [Candidatus Angelobacter sp.]
MWGSSITLEEYPLEDALRLMHESGFTRVELWKHHLKRCKTPELRQQFIQYMERIGLEMGGFNAVGEDYYQPFGSDHALQVTLDGLKADLEFALSLGVRDVLIWEGVRPQNSSDSYCEAQLLPRLVELFRAALKFAEPANARFLVEPHPFTVGMNDGLLAKLYDALDSPHFGIIYDCCHFGVGQPADYVGAIKRLGRRICHIHFSDSDQKTSELHYIPGTGRLDLQRILGAFKEVQYDGTLTLDLYGYPTPLYGIQQSIPMLRHAYEYLSIRI